MANSIYPPYPPPLTAEQTEYLFTTLKDWTIAHGLAVRPAPGFVSKEQDPSGVLATTAPVTLFPSLFPRSCFDEALSIQELYNEFYSRVARDERWLEGIVNELIGVDDFIANLWRIHLEVKREGYVQDLSLGLFRSDYMVHINDEGSDKKLQIKQVEFNTIASSFGGLAWEVSTLHKYLLSVDAYPGGPKTVPMHGNLATSNSVPGLAAGLAVAHKTYEPSNEFNRLCVIFLVQDPERNVFDQRHLEYALLAQHGIRSFRLPWQRILQDTEMTAKRTLVYRPPHLPDLPCEVSTIYFRAGYSPDEYKSEQDWTARLHLERSRAIKCPTVLTQLAGCKKVQQVLATPGKPPRRFMCDGERLAKLMQTFMPMYPMDDGEAGQEGKRLALDPESANRYVLKPQREGGGNNVYRKKIPEFLKSIPESHWPAWILMEMIEPPALRNAILRNGEIQEGGVIGELGVYGACLWRSGTGEEGQGEILRNFEAGYLLRTKGDQSEEGGVAAGFGAVDSCCLVDL
ncbi:glutathione synthase [Rhizodiscina lignyota]|uniref:Glutathione synthetase n=1 Tax=Rhizodiscina lignyota TaxID=1504668 RepID=A0A9P4IB45_9PEZI|nr:glutathione synthase [Rhizodiscina lignyota]